MEVGDMTQAVTDDDLSDSSEANIDDDDDDKYYELVKEHIGHLQNYSNDLMHLASDPRWPNDLSFLLLTAARNEGEDEKALHSVARCENFKLWMFKKRSE